ncbi:MAG: SCO family protein [Aquificae bacterium]|nr:SCO family protein [Aquificota bacterium]
MGGVSRRALLAVLPALFLLLACEERKQQGGVFNPQQGEYNGIELNKPAYNFCLKTAGDRTVCLKDILKEKDVVLLFFGYTHCPDVCPAAMYNLQKMMEKLDEDERKKVQVVFISVDPERDTPDLTDRYAKHFHPSFMGLTGSPEEIAKVAKKYMVYYKKVEGGSEGGYLVDHTAYIYLITKDGTLKLIYPTPRQKPELMAEDVKKILD